MKRARIGLLCAAVICCSSPARPQEAGLELPAKVAAGDAFTIHTRGTGPAVLYVIGLGQVLRRQVQLGQAEDFSAGTLYDAGRYVVFVVGAGAKESGSFDVTPAAQPAALSFLAKPSRLAVGQHNGISGAVYILDAYHNLITAPLKVSFELSSPSGGTQARSAISHDGSAWTQLDSSTKEGAAKFMARTGEVSSTRVIEEVPGEPCGLKLDAKPSGRQIEVQTDPVRDCSGNPAPDGTIVTFTEYYRGGQSTADVPLKHGVATVEMPAYSGARISAASGVVMGNEIRLGQ